MAACKDCIHLYIRPAAIGPPYSQVDTRCKHPRARLIAPFDAYNGVSIGQEEENLYPLCCVINTDGTCAGFTES